ncbi:MAG TPA: TIGR01777 family oxidoreductase [Myxococcota bacterium]|nr:TIGR01777 family oxidoreductase [Myxococcota bacterium]
MSAAAPTAGPVLITGATGLVGSRLVRALLAHGRAVRVLSRDAEAAGERFAALGGSVAAFAWDGTSPPAAALDGSAAAVHLAGEPLFGGLVGAAQLGAIRESRVRSTERLVEAIGALAPARRPRALVCASAVGIYGDRGEEALPEDAAPGDGFLAELCVAWERAAARAETLGVRAVRLRIGIVLAREGGALPRLALPIRFGVGGPLGSGRQLVPWIHVDDLVAMICAAIDDPRWSGAVNAVAPEPARNAELVRTVARLLHRPAFLRVPALPLKLALRELAGELLGSRRVVPAKALAAGFRFAHPQLEEALARELAPDRAGRH